MAGAQLEDGYTRIANEILESMARVKLSPTQYRLLFIIWRYTYGFQRKEHDMSLSFLSEATGCEKRSIQRDLKGLEERKIIKQNIKSGSYRKISFNKVTDEWIDKTRTKSIGETTNGKTTIGEIDNGRGGETTNGAIGETANQERNIKYNFKEKICSSSNGDEKFAEIMNFYQMNLQRGVTESPFNLELINQWYDEFGYDLLLAAMKVAAKQEAKGVAFVEGVLKKWREAGVRNIDDARKYEQDFKKGKQKRMKVINGGKQNEIRQSSYGVDYSKYDFTKGGNVSWLQDGD